MSYDDFDRTATIDKESASILDLIDERLSENEEVKKTELPKAKETEETSFFDTSTDFEPFEFEKPKKTENVLDNPFFGDPDAITKLRNKRAKKAAPVEVVGKVETYEVQKPTEAVKRIDGKQERAEGMSARRRKMWISTGIVCGVLMVGFVVCNIISLRNINNNITEIQNNIIVKEQKVTDLNSQITNKSGTVPEGMTGVNSVTIDASELYPTEIVPSDNVFNKIARFISYLFGK